MQEILWFALSWVLDLVIITVVTAFLSEKANFKIEKHQALGAFITFFIPTLIEYLSWKYFEKPVIFLLR